MHIHSIYSVLANQHSALVAFNQSYALKAVTLNQYFLISFADEKPELTLLKHMSL